MDDDGNGGYRSRGNGNGRGRGHNGDRGHNGGGNGGNGGNGSRGGFDRSRDDRRSGRRERDDGDNGDEPPQRRQRYEGGGGGGPGAPRRGQRQFREREACERAPEERFDFVSSRPDGPNGQNFAKKGTSGTAIALQTNYFLLQKRPAWKIYHYHVGFEPEERLTRIKMVLLGVHRLHLGVHTFDGSSLWTFAPLPATTTQPLVLESSLRRGDTNMVRMIIRPVAELEHSDVQCIQVYNVILRKCFEMLKLDQVGRNYYDSAQSIRFYQGQFELWPGYITTIRNYERGLMLNVEIGHRLLRRETALDAIRKCDSQERIRRTLIGSTVSTSYNPTMYRIDDIDFEKTPASTFTMGRGPDKTEVTYADYYRVKYGCEIKDMDQPLLGSRPKKKDYHRGKREMLYLIPETCQMTGITDEIRSNFHIMKEMGNHTHQVPQKKNTMIQSFMSRLHDNAEITNYLQTWGLEFLTEPVPATGRIAPPEKIIMEPESKPVMPDDKGDWTRAYRDMRMKVNMKLTNNWILIVPARDQHGVDNLVQLMTRTGGQMGFNVSRPLEIITLNQPYPEDYVNAIKQAVSNHRTKLELVFAILPNNKLENYSAIKRTCCVEFGIASQCFVARNLGKGSGLMSIATKVVVQINAKLGGEPWRVINPFKSSNLMVIGYDLYHCGKRRGASVGAMVGTTNNELSKFYSTLSTVDVARNKEFSETMCTDLSKLIRAYHKRNDGNLPDRIIMYRDGVGDGQLKYVHATELEEIKECLKGLYMGREPPKLSFIVVTKKINTRFFAKRIGGTLDNPPPGTFVDDVVTLPERYDFYLISQTAMQGTVSPTSYNVIWDEQGIPPDKLQRFSYKLTHLYYNWSGTVSVPAVCQYAHKMSYLAGIAMNGLPIKERLCDYLFYL